MYDTSKNVVVYINRRYKPVGLGIEALVTNVRCVRAHSRSIVVVSFKRLKLELYNEILYP